MRGAIAIVAMLTLSGSARPIDAYRDVRRELVAKYPDWMSGNESRDFAKTLNRVWSIVGEWTAAEEVLRLADRLERAACERRRSCA